SMRWLAFDMRKRPWPLRIFSADEGNQPDSFEITAPSFFAFAKKMGRWKSKNRRIPIESASLDAFGQKDFWQKLMRDSGTGEVRDAFRELKEIEFEFRLTGEPGAALVLIVDIQFGHTLYFRGAASGDLMELGWFDQAGWRPYALRWEELRNL